MEQASPTPDYIKTLNAPTAKFLCTLKDNVFDIKFGAFRLRDMVSGFTLVDVRE
jgi:hypothetical protein